MNKQPTDEKADEACMMPFDNFPGEPGKPAKPMLHLAQIATFLRILCALALVFAFAGAIGLLVLDALRWVRPDIGWKVKSAFPLIGIGLSYALLQFTLPRSRAEFFLSLAVSVGFVLWGVEQFVPVPWIVSVVDDVVVFLFVLDLGVVIWSRLKRSIWRTQG